MSKRVGFWFYVGDWMKDPELRFCSIFARGLLIDLLCLCFESVHQGKLAKPDGTPRTDAEILDAISGGSRDQKIQALRELENSGALKRCKNTGVLYSSRILEIAEKSKINSKNGSKKGAKARAKAEQTRSDTEANAKRNGSENRGVSVSVSDSDSDTRIFLPSKGLVETSSLKKSDQNAFPRVTPLVENVEPALATAFRRWLTYRFSVTGAEMPEIVQETVLIDLQRRGAEKATQDVEFSIRISAKNILDSSHDLQKQGSGSASTKSYGQTLKDKVGI
jgi:hypothetical protein